MIDLSERIALWHDRESWEQDQCRSLTPYRVQLAAMLRVLPAPEQAL
jgi:hypothetical protein